MDDIEPTEFQLAHFGYAEGHYTGRKCRDCQTGLSFVSKRTFRCKECATKEFKKPLEVKSDIDVETNVSLELKKLQKENRMLREALKTVRAGICATATDTIWVYTIETAVDLIDATLAQTASQ